MPRLLAVSGPSLCVWPYGNSFLHTRHEIISLGNPCNLKYTSSENRLNTWGFVVKIGSCGGVWTRAQTVKNLHPNRKTAATTTCWTSYVELRWKSSLISIKRGSRLAAIKYNLNGESAKEWPINEGQIANNNAAKVTNWLSQRLTHTYMWVVQPYHT